MAKSTPVRVGYLANEGSIQEQTREPADLWGEEAARLLDAVVAGPHYRKKRHTLLRLAEAAYLNSSQADVFKMASCASKVAHYKWREVDPDYQAAYAYLVGDTAVPGLARLRREAEIDEAEQLAIGALAEARAILRLASAEAAGTLHSALNASNSYGPKWHERISAANSILDRADHETAARQAPALAIVDQAILNVYGNGPDDDDAKEERQAGLPADNRDTLANETQQDEHELKSGEEEGHEPSQPPAADQDISAARQALSSYFANENSEKEEETTS